MTVPLFPQTVNNLKNLLRDYGVSDDIRETRFETNDGFNSTDEPLVRQVLYIEAVIIYQCNYIGRIMSQGYSYSPCSRSFREKFFAWYVLGGNT